MRLHPRVPTLLLLALAAPALASCGQAGRGRDDAKTVTFLHAADPLVLPADAAGVPVAAANRDALAAAMRSLQQRARDPSPPSFLLLAGDFGGRAPATAPAPAPAPVPNPTPDTTPAAGAGANGGQGAGAGGAGGAAGGAGGAAGGAGGTAGGAGGTAGGAGGAGGGAGGAAGGAGDGARAAALDALAMVLASTPVPDLFLVPGPSGSDVGGELGKRQGGGATVLHDLSTCYRTGVLRECAADLSGDSVRLVGFSLDTTAADTVQRVRTLLALVKEPGTRPIVVAASALPTLRQPPTSVPRADTTAAGGGSPAPALDRTSNAFIADSLFREVLSTDRVVMVLAPGTAGAPTPSPKVRWTPALGTRLPDRSLAAERAVTLVTVADGAAGAELLRYRPGFGGAAAARTAERPWFFKRWVLWMWNLAPQATQLARAAVVFLALLFAFLTVAEVGMPTGRGKTVTRVTTSDEQAGADTGANTTTVTTTTAPSIPVPGGPLFEGRLARLVWSGLTGIALVSLLTDEFWRTSGLSAAAYYVVWFIFLFLVLLLLNAVVRALTEGMRSRIASARFVAGYAASRRESKDWEKARHWLGYWIGRPWRWILSLREFFLVLADTFTNEVFGRSFSANQVWENKVVANQRSLLRAADRVREEITSALRRAIQDRHPLDAGALDEGLRVAVSVLSDDGNVAFYISAPSGSLSKQFDRTTIAWVAARIGAARWWVEGDEAPERNLVLYGNDPPIVEAPGQLYVKDYFEKRERRDYRAFMLVPLPWRRRNLPRDTRRGLIHISFADPEWMTALWPRLAGQSPPADDPFAGSDTLLEDPDLPETVRAVLGESVNVLAELISQFDQVIYENRIRPERGG